MKSEYRKRGFQEVISPNVYNAKLWVRNKLDGIILRIKKKILFAYSLRLFLHFWPRYVSFSVFLSSFLGLGNRLNEEFILKLFKKSSNTILGKDKF